MKGRDIFLAVLILSVAGAGCAGDTGEAPTAAQVWTRAAANPILIGTGLPILGDMAVLHDEGAFKMWFAHGYVENGVTRVRTEYATSPDGLRWTWEGVALSPGGEGAWDMTTAETPMVIRDDGESNPARRYKMYYSGSNDSIEGGDYGVGIAFSPDGRVFTKLPSDESPLQEEGRVLRPGTTDGDVQAVADPTVILREGMYRMWYTTGMGDAPELVIGYTTSNDGIHWTKHPENPVLRPTQSWEKGNSLIVSTAVQPTVLFENGEYRMWYAAFIDMAAGNHLTAGFGYATSPDGIHWTKPYEQPAFAPNRGPGEEAGLMTGPCVVRVGDRHWLFYPGCRGLDPYTTVINVATRPAS